MGETGHERAVSPVFSNRSGKRVRFYPQTLIGAILFFQACSILYDASLAGIFSTLQTLFSLSCCFQSFRFFVCLFVCLLCFCFPMEDRLPRKTWTEIPGPRRISLNQAHHDFLLDCICKEVKFSRNLEMIRGHNLSLCIDHFSGYSGSDHFPNHRLLRVWHWYCGDSNWRGQWEPDQFPLEALLYHVPAEASRINYTTISRKNVHLNNFRIAQNYIQGVYLHTKKHGQYLISFFSTFVP